MKTFVFSARPYEIPFLDRATEGKHELFYTDQKLTVDTARLAVGCEAVALFTADDASAAVINKLNSYGIRFIALRSAGYDHVDLRRAETCGIQVANVPSYSPYSIAEHAVAMLLTLNRRIPDAQALMRMHDYRLDTLVGFDIHGKTVGIIGTGTIGLKFASIMKGFGAKLIGVDPVKHQEAEGLGLEYVTMEALLKRSDIISIQLPVE